MTQAFKGERLHIAVLGRCNVGKSTVLNCITGQKAAIVSPQAGTTGDPVPIAFELLPLGPVTFYDTAGLDEGSDLGVLRREAGRKVLARADLAVLVTDEKGIGPWEKELAKALQDIDIPFLVIFNKADVGLPSSASLAWCAERGLPHFSLSADRETDSAPLRKALIALVPAAPTPKALITDILPPGGTVILVTPIDASAPKGRLIAPQVQVLRELVEGNFPSLVVQSAMLAQAFAMLREPPALVLTDSQVVHEVAKLTPADVSLTTFSVVFARYKADFSLLLEGAKAIDSLPENGRVLIAEACSHHAQNDDIARVKLPAMLKRQTGRELTIDICSGRDFPDNLESYDLVIHCGGCMLNPGEMNRRLRICLAAGVKATNFGMAISLCQGVLSRVASPFVRR